MPDFTVDDLYISPREFVNECSTREMTQLIDILIECGYIPDTSNIGCNIHDELFQDAIDKIRASRHILTKTEEDIIKAIADRL